MYCDGAVTRENPRESRRASYKKAPVFLNEVVYIYEFIIKFKHLLVYLFFVHRYRNLPTTQIKNLLLIFLSRTEFSYPQKNSFRR